MSDNIKLPLVDIPVNDFQTRYGLVQQKQFVPQPIDAIAPEVLNELTEIRPENKEWMLLAMGFKPMPQDKRYWTHPAMKETYLLFSLKQDAIEDFIPKLVKLIQDAQLVGMGRAWMVR